MGSSSNRYAPRLPQQETKLSTKQLAPTDPILGPENLLKTGFAQKGLPSCPSGRHKPQSFIETKTLRFCNPDTKTSKNEPKHGPKNGTAWRSHFWDRMHSFVKEQKKSTFTVQAVPKMRPQNRKIHSKGRPLQQTKNYNCVYLSNQHIDLEQRRPAHAKPDFN